MKFLTIRETAEYLQLSEMTLYRMANLNMIPVVRVGSRWRFPLEILDKWLIAPSEERSRYIKKVVKKRLRRK
jgi:excisionase family DNA binding protein